MLSGKQFERVRGRRGRLDRQFIQVREIKKISLIIFDLKVKGQNLSTKEKLV